MGEPAVVLANPPPTPWPLDLHSFFGSPERLSGIRIYHDFLWEEVFDHRRKQFRNGQRLTELIRKECPKGKSPALLLTVRKDGIASPIRTDSEYIVVVKVHEYLREASADPACTFFARGAKGPITGISAIHDLVVTPDVLDAFLSTHLDINALGRWARGKSQRLEQLADLAGTVTTSDAEPANIQDVTKTLESLDRIDDKLLSTLQALLSRTRDNKQRGVLLRALTNTAEGLAQAQSELNDRNMIIVDDLEKLLNDPSATQTDLQQFFQNHPWLLATSTRLHLLLATRSRDGLAETGRVFGKKIADRLETARKEAEEYTLLVRNISSTETDLQQFIQEHPWLIGLEYARVRPKQKVLRGEMDFFLERFDGFHDILELKDPQDPIIKAADAVNGRPPPPHDFSLRAYPRNSPDA